MSVVAVIPCRYGSTRLQGKPLLAKTGKPLIQHVYENVLSCASVDRVIVATDDERVFEAAEKFGAEVEMTSLEHSTGTDRVAEVASRIEGDIFVNIQGDEPELQPDYIDGAIELLKSGPYDVSTLCSPVTSSGEMNDVNIVKCVIDNSGRALFFSRASLPYIRDEDIFAVPPRNSVLRHHGIYCFRRELILKFTGLEPPHIERAEQLEQLRLLWYGYSIGVHTVDDVPMGIDTPADYEAFVSRVLKKGNS